MDHKKYLGLAYAQAKKSYDEGGIPIGSVLVIGTDVVGAGHNRRVQDTSAILHGEMDCLENAGRLTAAEYARSVLYSTLSPCDMCSGACLLYKIPTVVIGESRTFRGPESYLQRGVELVQMNDAECYELLQKFIAEHPEIWNEDIGLPPTPVCGQPPRG